MDLSSKRILGIVIFALAVAFGLVFVSKFFWYIVWGLGGFVLGYIARMRRE